MDQSGKIHREEEWKKKEYDDQFYVKNCKNSKKE